jgi:hypothetical protein
MLVDLIFLPVIQFCLPVELPMLLHIAFQPFPLPIFTDILLISGKSLQVFADFVLIFAKFPPI